MKTGENTIAKCSFMLIAIKNFMMYRAADTYKNNKKNPT